MNSVKPKGLKVVFGRLYINFVFLKFITHSMQCKYIKIFLKFLSFYSKLLNWKNQSFFNKEKNSFLVMKYFFFNFIFLKIYLFHFINTPISFLTKFPFIFSHTKLLYNLFLSFSFLFSIFLSLIKQSLKIVGTNLFLFIFLIIKFFLFYLAIILSFAKKIKD